MFAFRMSRANEGCYTKRDSFAHEEDSIHYILVPGAVTLQYSQLDNYKSLMKQLGGVFDVEVESS